MDAAGELLKDYRWLTSAAAASHLRLAADEDPIGPKLLRRFRKELSKSQTHLLVEQVELRRRARLKFGDAADNLLFTRQQLEQATSATIAAYKAARFPPGLVADLCCGIGGDLLQLGRRGPALGIDLDPIAVLLAQANLAAAGVDAQVRESDAADAPVAEAVAWHLDPDRRPAGRRTTQVAAMQPAQETIDQLLAANENACIKLAPATSPPTAWQDRAEWEWIGEQRECKGLLTWFGDLSSRHGQRSATVLEGGAASTVTGEGDLWTPPAAECGAFIIEPHAAVRAAGLSGELAERFDLRSFGQGGYLTGDRPLDDPLLACFEVLETLPYDAKRIRAAVRRGNYRVLEMKARGAALDAPLLARLRAMSGEQPALLMLTKTSAQHAAVLVRRVEKKTND